MFKVILKSNTNMTLNERFCQLDEMRAQGINAPVNRRSGWSQEPQQARGFFRPYSRPGRGSYNRANNGNSGYADRNAVVSYVRGGGGRGYFGGRNRRPYGGVQRGRVIPRRDPRDDPAQLQKQLTALEYELKSEYQGGRGGYVAGGRFQRGSRRGFYSYNGRSSRSRGFGGGNGRGGRGGRGGDRGRGRGGMKKDPEELKQQLDREMDDYQQQSDL